MSRWLPWVLTALGAFIAFILYLNTRERDYYDEGSLTPVTGDPASDPVFSTLISETIKHECATCGSCVHPVEVLENRRTLSLRDRDGWYRLFWAGDETYYFEELQHLAASYENRTAALPQGEWLIRARLGPASHPRTSPHPCSGIRPDIILLYKLVIREPGPGESLAETRPSLVWRYYGDKLPPLLYFDWVLSGTTLAAEVPCPCGKP